MFKNMSQIKKFLKKKLNTENFRFITLRIGLMIHEFSDNKLYNRYIMVYGTVEYYLIK